MKITKNINKEIFRAYDIRGIADRDLTDDVICSSLSKTGDVPFEIDDINIVKDDKVFTTMANLNSIRRKAFDILSDKIVKSFKNVKEKTENNTIQVDNKVTSNLITWDNVYASSHLIQKSMNYKVENVIDDNPSTAWIEGVSDDGIGQFIQFSSNNTFRVDKIDIINGFSKNQKTYMKNNRVKKVIIEFSDKSQQVYELEDNNMEYQTIDIGGINTNSVKVIIQEVYTNGRVYKDTCISEISVYGQEL